MPLETKRQGNEGAAGRRTFSSVRVADSLQISSNEADGVRVIVKAALRCNGDGVWPDDDTIVAEVESLSGYDKNIVGNAWRWVGKVGLLCRGDKRRRSTAGASKGREIAEWRVLNVPLARTFLSRNGAAMESNQKELFSA